MLEIGVMLALLAPAAVAVAMVVHALQMERRILSRLQADRFAGFDAHLAAVLGRGAVPVRPEPPVRLASPMIMGRRG